MYHVPGTGLGGRKNTETRKALSLTVSLGGLRSGSEEEEKGEGGWHERLERQWRETGNTGRGSLGGKAMTFFCPFHHLMAITRWAQKVKEEKILLRKWILCK